VEPLTPPAVARAALVLALVLLVVGVGANAAGLLEERATDRIAVAGLALLVVSQAIRGWLQRTFRPVAVLALVVALLALVILDVL
jgi:hypothetical protein